MFDILLNGDLGLYAQKNITSEPGSWDGGIKNAYFKMSKSIIGDAFVPFLKMPTDNGAWVIGMHCVSDQLMFRFYANETGGGTAYKLHPDTTKDL